MFLAGGLVQGLPWGVFQTLAISYAADLCPTHLRGMWLLSVTQSVPFGEEANEYIVYMTSWVNMCWVIGGLLSTGILRGLFNIDGQWGYRIPFALQWVWPIPIIIGTLVCPESPWWLVRRGRLADAKASLKRLSSDKTDEELDDTVASKLRDVRHS